MEEHCYNGRVKIKKEEKMQYFIVNPGGCSIREKHFLKVKCQYAKSGITITWLYCFSGNVPDMLVLDRYELINPTKGQMDRCQGRGFPRTLIKNGR